MQVLSMFYKNDKGGYTKRLYELYNALTSEGDEIHFLGTETIPVKNKLVNQYITKIPIGNKIPAIFWVCFIAVFTFRALLIAETKKIDRIVTFGPFYTLVCAIPILLMKIPSVTFIRADNMLHSSNRLRNTIFYLIDWLGIMLSSKVIFVSATLKDTYVTRYKIRKDKLKVIHNNIQSDYTEIQNKREAIRQSLGIEKEDFLISSSGVFNEDKNFVFLIHAMKILAPYNVKLIIIGDEVKPNGERYKLEQIAAKLGVTPYVIFSGWLPDPKPLIAASNLFAFPSKHEGSPNSLLEALGCRIPCLGSNIKEIEEVLKYDDLLFVLDDETKFINKVVNLISDPIYYEHVRILSNERCMEFNFNWCARVIYEVHSK